MPAPGAPPPQQGAPPPGSDADDQTAGASDQDDDDDAHDNAQMAQFVAQCRLAIYKTPSVTEATIQSLKTGDPVQALAHVTLGVVSRVNDAATQAGEKLDPSVLLHGGLIVAQDIADFSNQIAKAQGTPTYTDKQINQAYLIAVDLFRAQQQASGQLDTNQAAQFLQAIKQAQQEGKLDEVLPGATEAAKQFGKDAPATPAQGQPQSGGAAPPLMPKRKRRRR